VVISQLMRFSTKQSRSRMRDLALTQSGDFVIDASFYQAISLRMRDLALTQSGDFAIDAPFYQAIKQSRSGPNLTDRPQ
jgi:hypothetical protein